MSAIDRLMRSMSLDLTNRSSRNSRIHFPESMLVALFSQSQPILCESLSAPRSRNCVTYLIKRKLLPALATAKPFQWKKKKFNEPAVGGPPLPTGVFSPPSKPD
jgi:hypothetical protein